MKSNKIYIHQETARNYQIRGKVQRRRTIDRLLMGSIIRMSYDKWDGIVDRIRLLPDKWQLVKMYINQTIYSFTNRIYWSNETWNGNPHIGRAQLIAIIVVTNEERLTINRRLI